MRRSPETESAAEDRIGLNEESADTVVIESRPVAPGKIPRLEGAPDIGAPDLGGGIAGAVREQDDFSAMEMPRRDNQWNCNLRCCTIAHYQRIKSELDHMN